LEAVYLESEVGRLQAELERFQTRLAANKKKQTQFKTIIENVPTSNTMGLEVSRDAE
jgi:hypothetical protein